MSTITTKGQKAKAVNARDFDIRDMIGYALGDVGNNFTFNLVNSFLMIFYTNVFGLAAALVGALFMAARLVDAFVDIMVGRLIDNSKMTKRGRFTPWVMRMKFPLAASAILPFLPTAGHLPMTTRVVYAFVTYLPGASSTPLSISPMDPWRQPSPGSRATRPRYPPHGALARLQAPPSLAMSCRSLCTAATLIRSTASILYGSGYFRRPRLVLLHRSDDAGRRAYSH
ncbi:glucuronide transporter UidB [Cutibacterium acnes JCM 18920]|nr:glucuronide transporter UidB [Cutibacterium acnes JCM 18920]